MKKTSLIILIVIFITTPFMCCFTVDVFTNDAYSSTYLAALSDKYDLLCKENNPKIVLVGGSNLAFGIDSQLLQENFNMPVVNFGLYAALGSKHMLDLTLANINRGDIVIFVPEYSQQMLSLYTNPEIMLQALETKRSMLWRLPFDDYFSFIAAYPAYLSSKIKISKSKSTVSSDTVYLRKNFNIMPQLREGTDVIFDTDIISDDFIDYFNQYAQAVKNRGAQVMFGFTPVNKLAVAKESTFEQRLSFYNYIYKNFDAKILGNIEEYLLSENYFYDSNYHLNNNGSVYRTILLIRDLKAAIDDFSYTPIPLPSEPEIPAGNVDNTNMITDLSCVKYLKYIIQNSSITITGLLPESAQTSRIIIPSVIDNLSVTAIADNAFSDITGIAEIYLPSSISSFGNNVFANSSITSCHLKLGTTIPYITGESLSGLNASFKILVPANRYATITTNYFWSPYSKLIISE